MNKTGTTHPQNESHLDTTQKQTVKMRSPDGSADLYQLIAGLAVACRHGFEMENALELAEEPCAIYAMTTRCNNCFLARKQKFLCEETVFQPKMHII